MSEVTVVFQGGGGKGVFGVGTLTVMDELGIRIGKMFGTSIGALVMSGYSVGRSQLLHDVFLGNAAKGIPALREQDAFKKYNSAQVAWRVLVQKKRSIYDFSPLLKTIKKYMGDGPYPGVRVGIVDVASGEYLSVPADAMSVLASASMPVYAEPVGNFMDGGIAHTTPIGEAIDAGAESIVLILCNPMKLPGAAMPDTAWGIGARSLEIAIHTATVVDIQRAFAVNERLKLAEKYGEPTPTSPSGKPYRYVPITVVEPPEPLGETLDLSQVSLRRRFDLGVRTARQIFAVREAA